MSWAWLDGGVSEESFKEEYYLAYEDMKCSTEPAADVQVEGGGSEPGAADSKPSTTG